MDIKEIIKAIYHKIKNFKRNVYIPLDANIGIKSSFEGNNRVGHNTIFNGTIGLCSYIGADCCLEGTIGRFCSIASEVKMTYGTHPKQMMSTSPVFYSINTKQCGISYCTRTKFEEHIYADTINKIPIIIENDVWIGYRATILSGVRICNGAIVGANALVTKDVPPYAIVGGVPARIIGYRFDKDRINYLIKLAWWNLPLEEIKKIMERNQ